MVEGSTWKVLIVVAMHSWKQTVMRVYVPQSLSHHNKDLE